MRLGLPGLLLLVSAGSSLAAAGLAPDLTADPAPEDYLFGTGMALPAEERTRTFRPDVNRARFTSFHGAECMAADGQHLVLRLTETKATLGWGNYGGRQRPADVEDMGQQTIAVRLRLKQSADTSLWTVRLWRDGHPLDATAEATLKGRAWQTLSFKQLRVGGANPDGLELTVHAPKGTQIELEWLKLVQPTCEGCCRTEFTLPEGKIWRAVANVGSANERHWMGKDQMASRLHINGRVVERRGAQHLYHTDPVDIAPYLKPGRNCIGFYGFRIGHTPFLFFQARIVMTSGKVVTVTSGPHWKHSPAATDGWDEPGFDDAAWQPVRSSVSPWLTVRDASGRVCIPAYTGRLVIRNPGHKDLFYPASDDVVIDVHVPPGLASRHPTLAYALGRVGVDGRCETAGEDTVADFDARDGSLVYRLNLGRRAHGVYAVALLLRAADGSVIEDRPREPLVVLRRMPQEQIEGRDYRAGLDLELEDTVDFTDPDAPHPWIEAKMPPRMFGQVAEKVQTPVIVRKGGLVYREVADTRRGSGFSYRIEFKHPGSFYLLELEYPDDTRRVVEAVISSKTEGVWTNSQSGVGAERGGRFLPTGTMQTLRWIHVADPGPHSIDILNVIDGAPAAARRLRIHRIRGHLPAVETGAGRSYGIHTERCFFTSGIGMNFGVGRPQERQAAREEDRSLPPMRTVLKDLVWMKETGERYVEYLRFAGQNCHVMGTIQYGEYNTPFAPAPQVDTSRIVPCMKTMLANLLDTHGIAFYAGVEFSQSYDVRTYANNAQVARGADTVWMVNAHGRQRYGHDKVTVVPNWFHPAVRGKYLDLMDALADTFGHLEHFRGVHGLMGPTVGAGYWVPAYGEESRYDQPLIASYDDETLRRFTAETGVRLPVEPDDPERFEKRASLLRTPALRRRFVPWRCDKVRQFFADAVAALRRKRGDLEFVNALAVEDTRFFRHVVRSDKPFDDVMRAFAIDVGRLNTVDGLWTGRWTVSWRQTGRTLAGQDPFCWLGRTAPDVIATFPPNEKRYVFVRTSWDENMLPSPCHAMKDRRDHDRLVESDWIMNGSKIRALPQPGGAGAREAFVHAMITGDPNLLLGGFTDLNINVGHEQALRQVLLPYTHLPADRFEPVLDTGLETNLAIRRLSRGDESWFYVANPCQWPVEGFLTLSTDGAVTEVPSGKAAATVRRRGDLELPLHLEPFGLAAYRVASGRLAITGYTTEPLAGEALGRLQRIPDRVAVLLNDPAVRLSLAPGDRRFMHETLGRVRDAVAGGLYAKAWSLLTHHRFWSLWQDFLEKAPAATARAGEPKEDAPPPKQITYDTVRDCIHVVGFPESQPATLEAVRAADREGGWGKVTYDEASDTYTVDADLWIGDDRSLGTFLQLGTPRHPRVTAVVRGTVWVRPPRPSGERSDGLPCIINRLRLGDPADDRIRATLKIHCETSGQHGVYVGYRSHDSKTILRRGSLHVYRSTITAAVQDVAHRWGVRDYTDESASPRWSTPGWYASDVRLVGATISWFEGCVTYGTSTGRLERGAMPEDMRSNPPIIFRDTTFEHGEEAVRNGLHYLQDCTLRHMTTAVAEGGALAAKLVGCTLADNRANWTLGSIQSRGIVLRDTTVEKPANSVVIRKNHVAPDVAARQNIPLYPRVRHRRTLVVKVVDAAGHPVPEAVVMVTCAESPEEVTRGATVTDAGGLTPSDPEANAIVVTERAWKATDEPEAPDRSTFGYGVVVRKDGFDPAATALVPGRPIPRPLTITLERSAPQQ